MPTPTTTRKHAPAPFPHDRVGDDDRDEVLRRLRAQLCDEAVRGLRNVRDQIDALPDDLSGDQLDRAIKLFAAVQTLHDIIDRNCEFI